ncbi:hypothetical protein E1B28_009220 [Marasmius oreades]|uniref:Uncharacterized protein n=1 Tax=Marasmius oreades TaxID=181124 RepID=A0A9P7UT67_9AGAR|nr:uncharacterized protein E1B28_009220 [Marasmius oreades]KAG7092915.1 hypothetical protein E1B28_009220 [Marasmius oreades]
MTESVINSQDIRQYWSTQDRVNHWVEEHHGLIFNSPNIPPSELDGEDGALSCGVSEVESSHSLPPKLMLRYPDGKEIPIPHPSSPKDGGSRNPSLGKDSSPGLHSSHRSRSGSAPSGHSLNHPTSPHSDHHVRERERLRSRSPEEIRILPSDHAPETMIHDGSRNGSHASHHSNRTRSRSLPRDASLQEEIHIDEPLPSPPHSHSSRIHGAAYPSPLGPPIKVLRTPPPDPKLNFARSQPTAWHPYTNGSRMAPLSMNPHRHVHHPKHMPPAIIYAPSNNSRNHYNPPAIYSYPPNFGPDGVMYSHSIPPARMYHHAGGTYPSAARGVPSSAGHHPPPQPYPSHPSKDRTEERHRGSVDEKQHAQVSRGTNGSSKSKKSSKSRKSGHDRSKSLPLQETFKTPAETPARPPSPSGSDASGSTYYVLPTRKQKVHVLRPNQAAGSIHTATSSTKSPTTPVSPTGSLKKPLFARLRGLAERLSSGGSDKSLRRRHSTGNSSSSQEKPAPGRS